MSNAYIRFLNLIDVLGRINPGLCFNDLEVALLEWIKQHQDHNQTLLVGNLIGLKHLGSQATLHKRLKSLVVKKFIQLTADKKDARKKSVIPTKLAFKYIQFMSNFLVKSSKVA